MNSTTHPRRGGTLKDQPTEGGDASVMTRVIVRAQKKRDFRKSELQDVNKELDDMLEKLSRRSTMDKDELRSNVHHIVRAQLAAFALDPFLKPSAGDAPPPAAPAAGQ